MTVEEMEELKKQDPKAKVLDDVVWLYLSIKQAEALIEELTESLKIAQRYHSLGERIDSVTVSYPKRASDERR